MSKPLIVHVCAFYPPHLGGMEIVAKEISFELARRQYPVIVFTSNIGGKLNIDGKFLRIKQLKSLTIAGTPIMWTLFFRLILLPKKSIIHVHISQAGIPEMVFLAAKLKGIKYVAHYHLDVGPSSVFGYLLPVYKKYFLGPVLRHADRVIVFSEEQLLIAKLKYELASQKMSIIPNGVGKLYFSKNERHVPSEKMRILYVGRLSIQKRIERIIEMMSIIRIPAELTIVGSGDEENKLALLVKKLDLESVVKFVGAKYGEELNRYYQNADILVISSDVEGMPLVILEAMAAGLPIIGSNVVGIRELIVDVGIIVNEPYPQGFSDVITRLWNNKNELLELSRRSKEKSEEYSWDKLITRLESIYKELLLNNNPQSK